MPLLRLTCRELTLFNNEKQGPRYLALYIKVYDAAGTQLSAFEWNNRSRQFDDPSARRLDDDIDHPNVLDISVSGRATVRVEAFGSQADPWPNAASHQTHLGGAFAHLDPANVDTLGVITLGPTTTLVGNRIGYQVVLEAETIAAPVSAAYHVQFRNILLYSNENRGADHIALYARVTGPGVDEEFR